MRKKLPIGVEDYVMAQNYYFVDKSLLIKDLIDGYLGKSVLITRPRRFGKTLLMSMVDCYFDIGKKSSVYFEDKKIGKMGEFYRSYLNAQPVVHLNMKNVRGRSKDEIIAKAKDAIQMLFRMHSYLLDSPALFESDKKAIRDILEKGDLPDYAYEESIYKLCSYLYFHFNKKIILLIDEYDTPLESAYENGIYDECIDFFKELYSSSFKGNDFTLLSICTGVLEISKESLFSGLNNLEVCSVAGKGLSPYFGFSESEVMEMLTYYGAKEDIKTLRAYYGQYRFGEESLFNPWSILNYLESGVLAPYWVNSGSNNLVDSLLDERSREKLLPLLSSGTSIPINIAINYRDLHNDENSIYSYLVHAGYLSAKQRGNGEYELSLVNGEIKEMFQLDIIGRGVNKKSLSLGMKIKEAFLNGHSEDIKSYLEEYILASYSYYDLKEEKDYQNMLTGLLAVLFEDYVVKSEVNAPKGRCDILISPKKEGDLGMAIELKHFKYNLSKSNMLSKAEAAIRQIKERHYIDELKQRKCSKILLYAIVFDPKKHLVASEEI